MDPGGPEDENFPLATARTSFNMKADLSIPICMRVHHLRRIYVVHWSGGCKPAVLEASDAADQHEEAALLSYKEAYRNLKLLSAASERHMEGQPRQHPLGGGTASSTGAELLLVVLSRSGRKR